MATSDNSVLTVHKECLQYSGRNTHVKTKARGQHFIIMRGEALKENESEGQNQIRHEVITRLGHEHARCFRPDHDGCTDQRRANNWDTSCCLRMKGSVALKTVGVDTGSTNSLGQAVATFIHTLDTRHASTPCLLVHCNLTGEHQRCS